MKPSELNFCVHSIEEREGEPVTDEKYNGLNIITFCPIEYWTKHKCLPDYFFTDEIDIPLPEGYKEYIFVEECQWASHKLKNEITQELINLGFVENKNMEYFLTDCWL